MKTSQITFTGALGTKLAARLDEPEEAARAVAIFAHCFTCTKDLPAIRRIATALTDHGFAVLRFDFSGLGQSEGDFAASNFSSNVEDLLCAANWLSENAQAPSLLLGHSLGGAAVLAAAGKIGSVKAVATIGAPSEPQHIAEMFTGLLAQHLGVLGHQGKQVGIVLGKAARLERMGPEPQFCLGVAGGLHAEQTGDRIERSPGVVLDFVVENVGSVYHGNLI